MTDLVKQFAKDAGIIEATSEELASIAALASRQWDLEESVKKVSAVLKEETEKLRQVQEVLLPEAMAAVNMMEFKLEDGKKITIKEDIFSSIKADFAVGAFQWLTEHQLGDIIKDEVKINLGRGEHDKVDGLLKEIRMMGFTPEEKMTVHPQTLKATIKEQMASGVEFPEEFFSIMPYKKAIIKLK